MHSSSFRRQRGESSKNSFLTFRKVPPRKKDTAIGKIFFYSRNQLFENIDDICFIVCEIYEEFTKSTGEYFVTPTLDWVILETVWPPERLDRTCCGNNCSISKYWTWMLTRVFRKIWPQCSPFATRGFGALMGLSPSNKAPSPPNWNVKHYKLVEIL